MGFLFTVFYQPTANVLFFLMDILSTNSLTVGILALVIVSKIILLPISVKNTKMQVKIHGVSDELKKIRETISDKKDQAEKTLAIYRREGINPLTPILSLLLQIPIFISIFFVVRDLGNGTFPFPDIFYPFVTAIESVNYAFLFSDLTLKGGFLLAFLIFLSQILLTHFTTKHAPGSGKSAQKIIFFGVMPILIALFSFFITATVGLYWLFNNLVSILQEVAITGNVRKESESESEQSEHPEA